MNILVLSDLHFDKDIEISNAKLRVLEDIAKETNFDVILSRGDNAELIENYFYNFV